MICTNCGESLPEHARYCPACGDPTGPREVADATQPFTVTHTNWHKEVDQSSHRAFANGRPVSTLSRPPVSRPFSPVPRYVRPPYRARRTSRFRRYFRPSLFFWVSMVALTATVMGGLSGLAVTLGRGIILAQVPPHHGTLTLQVTPSNVVLGAVITLRGSNFSPDAHVGLSRDGGISVFDTEGKSILVAKPDGTFSDTVIVSQNWQAGIHLIQAEDGTLHKTASFSIQVSGNSASLRPAHLLLSNTSLDLGSDDQTMNSTRTIILSNVGGGQISWHASATQPWLQFSPLNGTINGGQSTVVRIAGARSNLEVGFYSAKVLFTSNAGQAVLSVRMEVTPLEPAHEAILQVSPAVLSFTATDGATNPPAQVVTLSNPGMRPLQWSTSLSSSPTGTGSSESGWLSVSPAADTTLHGQSESIIVGVNIASLLPGSYSGVVNFTSQGMDPIQNSPQSVFVTLVVLPQCTLQISPGMLSYSSVYQQADPTAETVNLTLSSACTTSQAWNIASAPSWLSFSMTSGKAPTTLSVGAVSKGLQPGTYNGTILFNSQAGTQSLPVTYSVGEPTAPGLSLTPAALSFTAVAGQKPPPAQALQISNTGSGTLNWSAVAATTVGGSWLSVKQGAGSLSGQQSATIKVGVKLSPAIIPGTYSGTITVNGTDGNGQPISGGPQLVTVTLVVSAPCSITVSPAALSFTAVASGQTPPAQPVTITANGACANALNWTATVSGGNNANTWLTTTPSSGTVSLTASATTSVSVSPSGLQAGGSNATITISATDSVSGAPVGPSILVTVALNVQAACTLQPALTNNTTFTTEDGANPSTQTFTVSVSGACDSNLTITPTITQGAGSNWLAVTPGPTTMTGTTMTFTLSIASTTLADGTYSGSISFSAVDDGITVLGSPQTVSVALTVLAPPALAPATPTQQGNATTQPGISITQPNTSPTATTSQSIAIANIGGASLNWTATLPANAPSFLSLATSSGTLVGGANATIPLLISTAGVASGVYTTTVTIQATDSLTGNTVQGSPLTIRVTITVPES
ncbi:MAG TPA: choice-of-anchor D domain-containing protein [Ktedonobacteraceae bacterium]|nr:choice-of-anchor D domain-containing protein [Ktedonobacteraceae bacterium]